MRPFVVPSVEKATSTSRSIAAGSTELMRSPFGSARGRQGGGRGSQSAIVDVLERRGGLISRVYECELSRGGRTDLSDAVDPSWSPGDELCLARVAIRALELLREVVPADRLRGEGRGSVDIRECSDAGYQRRGHPRSRGCTVACGEKENLAAPVLSAVHVASFVASE